MTSPTKVYCDTNTNIFIAAMEMQGGLSDQAWQVLDAVDEGRLVAVTSELSRAEVLVKPLAARDRKLADSYEGLIASRSCFEVLAVERAVLVRAASLRADRPGLKLPDAIHVATALSGECRFFPTTDKRLAVPPPLTALDLGPHLLQKIVRGAP
ncbi:MULTISPECIES: PIN domain-containing protein [unclassified Chelatococcus]|uniref:type II toxin-antitoxin system VapC family toxin n=1 Tax=unclassified Chelatococcus TaxID=2638111 RepID=UPI0002E693AF|nr:MULTISPECIES: PIN domain-containing protein [unclassified Chelatococcus]